MLARADRRVRAVARRETLDQRLGRLEREATRIVGGIDHTPQQMALLVVPLAPAGAYGSLRGLHHQMRRREQAVSHVPGQTGEPGRTPIVHVHPDRAHRGDMRAPPAVRRLAGIRLGKLAQRVHTEVDVAAVPLVEQLGRAGSRGRGRVVEGAQMPQDAASRPVLGDQPARTPGSRGACGEHPCRRRLSRRGRRRPRDGRASR